MLEPEKAHPTGEFIIVAKFGGHVLHHLASRLANVIRYRGRQTKNLYPYLSFYNCCTVLCTVSGFSSSLLKVLFVVKYAYKLFFLDSNFRGVSHFWVIPT